ncbi:hypothetical protein CDL15_Pgr023913 [Punica granatum]|uniref:Uncharacterized protein n=1 Tax=Punica granatum TaxID=22663 RepID=A0A218XVJ4_PUNGR|nr:hypothetical protein CDL15_Pgr023913 [Punica granatum]
MWTIQHGGMAYPHNDDVRESLGIVHSRLDNHDSWMQYIKENLHKLTGLPIPPDLARGKQHCIDRSQGKGHEKDDGDDDE